MSGPAPESGLRPGPLEPTPRNHAAAAWLLALAALVLLAAELEISVIRPGRGLLNADAGKYAIAARQLSRTGLLNTTHTWPGQLARPVHPPFPAVGVGYPLLSIVEAGLFAVGGERTALTLVLPLLAYLLLVLASASLGRRLGGSVSAGWLCGLAVATSYMVLYCATFGMTDVPFAVLLTVALVLLWDLPERPRYVLLGLTLALAQLTRSTTAFLLPAFVAGVLLLAPAGRRLRGVLATLAAFLPGLVAFPLYRWVATGDPWSGPERYGLLAQLRPEFATYRVYRWVNLPDPIAYVAAHPGEFLHKLARFGPQVAKWTIGPESQWLAGLFLLYLVARASDSRAARFRIALVGLVALAIALPSATFGDPRLCLPLWPAVLAAGFGQLWRTLVRLGRGPRVATALCAVLLLFTIGLKTARAWRSDWLRGAPPPHIYRESEWRGFGRELAQRLPPGAVVASDVGTWVTWYADRPSLALPDDTRELLVCDQRLPLDALVLSNEWLIDMPASGEWRALYDGTATAPGWVRADSVQSGRLRAVIFRRVRGAEVGGGGGP